LRYQPLTPLWVGGLFLNRGLRNLNIRHIADDHCLGFHLEKGSSMPREKKNPIVAGALNMFVPGSGYLYVDNDRNRFIKTLIGGVLLIAVMIALSNAIQHIRGYSLPQGLCMGSLLLLVLIPLFLIGQKTAHLHNDMVDDTAQFNTRRATSQGSDDARLGKIQRMRDEGLISEQEYQKKKRDLSQ
jgi:uncharacterized membrane protein